MEIKDLKITSIIISNETQFHAITDNGIRLFDLNKITLNGKSVKTFDELNIPLFVE